MGLAVDINNTAWSDNWGFLPLTEREAEALIDSIKPILCSEGVIFGLVDDNPEAILVGLPKLNEAIADPGGR